MTGAWGESCRRSSSTNSYDEDDVNRGRPPTATRFAPSEIEAWSTPARRCWCSPPTSSSASGSSRPATARSATPTAASHELPWVSGIRITILGRETVINALVEAAGTTPLIGQIPLEELDLLVDPKSRELRVNPASPDAPLLDLLSAA